MERASTRQLHYVFGAIIGFPLLVAIAVSLYFSGTPKLSAILIVRTTTSLPVAHNVAGRAATPTTSAGLTATDIPPTPDQPVATQRPALRQNDVVVSVVRALLENKTGVYGIIIAQPGKAPEFSQNADVPFLSASLYKLVLLADIYEGVQNGVVSLDAELPLLQEYFPAAGESSDSYFDPATAPEVVAVSEALFAAGAFSSNVAARVLLTLTDEISLESTARELGMDHTYFFVDPRDLAEWPPLPGPDDDPAALAEAVTFVESQADEAPLMITTPRDIATYFDRLIADQVIDAEVSAEIMDILRQQVVDDKFPCLLPNGTDMAHKTGNLDHVVHDVGIIWAPEGPVILVAMVEDPADDAEASLVIQKLAYLTYTAISDPYAVLESPPESNCPGLEQPSLEASLSPESVTEVIAAVEPAIQE